MLQKIRFVYAIAWKRLTAQPGLALSTVIGLTVVIALAMSIPVYASAVYYQAFIEELSSPNADIVRPPFSFVFSFSGNSAENLTWNDLAPADSYLSNGGELGLPLDFSVRQVKTGNYPMYREDHLEGDPVARLRFGFVSDLADHITLLEGALPDEETGEVASVLVSVPAAFDYGLRVGEHYDVKVGYTTPAGERAETVVPVQISGVWQPTDSQSPYWMNKPSLYYDYLLMSESVFVEHITPLLANRSYVFDWYLVMDGSSVTSDAAGPLLTDIGRTEREAEVQLNSTRMMISPREELQRYIANANLLTVQLYAFGVPVIGLLLAFIWLTSALAVSRRQGEIAVLRSRGATAGQIVAIAALEASLLGGIAFLAGLPLSLFFAQLVSKTRSFLDFSSPVSLYIHITTSALLFGLLVVLLALVAQVIPTIGAARMTVTTYKQQRSRLSQAPWWQRVWLDVLLLIPAGYGAYVLVGQGGISTGDPVANPLLFLVSALGTLALTLLFLRLLPVLMSLLAWIVGRSGSVALLTAVRHLARRPGLYTMPLFLFILTLALSAFTATLAQTLDRHLQDTAYYQLGADAVFLDFGVEVLGMPTLAQRYIFPPVSDYAQTPLVYTVTRVGQMSASSSLDGYGQNGRFLAVDRFDFAQVAFWRGDFAGRSLGALMNELATNPDGVLLPRDLIETYSLDIGDPVYVSITSDLSGVRATLPLRVVGSFDLFPTWYPADGPLFVGNLDYVFERAGGDFPYYVWLDADPALTRSQLNAPEWQPIALNQPDYQIAKEEQRPERQGVFGLLSVGFLGAALLTVLGLLLYLQFSFQQRYIELGVLRAIGLSTQQMVWFLAWELCFIVLSGLLTGTLLGAIISLFTIPYLQVGSGVPPYIVQIAWPMVMRIYLLFFGLFVVALTALIVSLRRIRIFQAIKLGEVA